METFAVITENDESKWADQTGVLYHFPAKYINKLTSGTKVIYYKGQMKKKIYEKERLSKSPHYFGVATIAKVIKDKDNSRQYFAQITDFIPFNSPIPIKDTKGNYLEEVKRDNYWRDGVREISEDIYLKILSITDHKIKKDLLGSALIIEKDSLSNLDGLSISVVDDLVIHRQEFKNLNKGNNLKTNRSTDSHRYSNNSKIIGDRAEEIVLELLKRQGMKEIKWVAQQSEKPGYDISFIDKEGLEKYVEVKGTTAKRFSNFIFTDNELKSSMEHRTRYYIYLVCECLSKSPKVQMISNPFIHIEKMKWGIKPIAYNITF